jgi:hypothetical protein
LREEHRLRVFEDRVLRKILGHKTDEVIGEWSRLGNEELNDLYSLLNLIWVTKSSMWHVRDDAAATARGYVLGSQVSKAPKTEHAKFEA